MTKPEVRIHVRRRGDPIPREICAIADAATRMLKGEDVTVESIGKSLQSYGVRDGDAIGTLKEAQKLIDRNCEKIKYLIGGDKFELYSLLCILCMKERAKRSNSTLSGMWREFCGLTELFFVLCILVAAGCAIYGIWHLFVYLHQSLFKWLYYDCDNDWSSTTCNVLGVVLLVVIVPSLVAYVVYFIRKPQAAIGLPRRLLVVTVRAIRRFISGIEKDSRPGL